MPAWDWAVRLLHWTLAVLVAVDLVRDDGDYAHRLVGYAASSRRARAAELGGDFAIPRRPGRPSSLGFAVEGVSASPGARQAPRSAGHNPLGVWMVWLLWILVLLLGVTGWMSRLDAFWGDDRVHDAHALLADMMLIAVILHLAGVATMSWLWRENLPASMITGYKRPLQ